MTTEVEALRRRMLNLPDDELLEIVTTRRSHYRQLAIDLAAKELMRRNVPFTLPVRSESGSVSSTGEEATGYSEPTIEWARTLFFSATYYLLKLWFPAPAAAGIGAFTALVSTYPLVHKPLIPLLKWSSICALAACVVAAVFGGAEWARLWVPPPVADGTALLIIGIAMWWMPDLSEKESVMEFELWVKWCLVVSLLFSILSSILYLLFGDTYSSF